MRLGRWFREELHRTSKSGQWMADAFPSLRGFQRFAVRWGAVDDMLLGLLIAVTLVGATLILLVIVLIEAVSQ